MTAYCFLSQCIISAHFLYTLNTQGCGTTHANITFFTEYNSADNKLVTDAATRRQHSLVQDGCVAVAVLLNDGDNECYQLVPEVQTLGVGSICCLLRLWAVRLELSLVEFVAVVKEELVGGLHACLHAVLHHGACPGGTRQLLHLSMPVSCYRCLITYQTKEHVTQTSDILRQNGSQLFGILKALYCIVFTSNPTGPEDPITGGKRQQYR